MMSLSAKQQTGMEVSAADQLSWPVSASIADLATNEQTTPLIRSAVAFAALRHVGQRRDSDGAAFIEHPMEVARLLHDAGCSQAVIAAGLLHETVKDRDSSVAELTAHFGPAVANLVRAVSEDASVPSYRQRKHLLREQVRKAGEDAALLFAADQISKVRELPDRIKRDRARLGATTSAQCTGSRLERSYQLLLEHYDKSLRTLQDVAPEHPLVMRFADELSGSETVITTA